MKCFLILTLLVFYCFAKTSSDSCKNIKYLDESQTQIIHYAFNYGKKYDLGHTMAAIAWKESCAGLYRINFDDPSAGIYHAHLPGVIKRYYNAKDTPFRRNVVAEKLIRDQEFASKIALEELLFWKKIHKGHWKNIVKSYNKGFSWKKNEEKNKLAEAYYEDIAHRTLILQDYFAKNPSLPNPTKKSDMRPFKLLNER